MIKSLLWLCILQSILLASHAGVLEAFLSLFKSEVPCERVGNYRFHWTQLAARDRNAKTCFMNNSTIIDSVGFAADVTGFHMYENKKIQYLPDNVAGKFPSLKVWVEADCSIKSISKANFKNLSQLRLLALHSNEIETISSATFEDLVALETLWLGKL